MRKLKEFIQFALVALVIGLSVGYVLAGFDNPSGPPGAASNAPEPLNVSGTEQTTAAGKILTLPGGGTLSATNLLTTSLTIDGQIEILSGNPGVDKVLTSDATGLATWQFPVAPGVAKIVEGFGIDVGLYDPTPPGTIDYSVSSSTGITYIKINPGETQVRVANLCLSPQVMGGINASGVPTCVNSVTTATANMSSGLTLKNDQGVVATNATSGPITLAVNAGAGLKINSVNNALELNIDPAVGDGLMIDGATNKVKFETCAPGETWQYSAGKWNCVSFPSPASPQPGESVIYLRSKSGTAVPICSSLLSPSGWGDGITSTENVGGSQQNNARVCYRSDKTCQVVYLRSSTGNPTCPTSVTWTGSVMRNEYPPGGGGTNYVTTCYICN